MFQFNLNKENEHHEQHSNMKSDATQTLNEIRNIVQCRDTERYQCL